MNLPVIMMLLLMLVPRYTQGQILNDTFKWCDLKSYRIVTQANCEPQTTIEKVDLYYVLHQLDHPIQGEMAYCEITDVTITLTDNFFSRDTKECSINHLLISSHDCKEMAQTMKRFGNPMSSLDTICEYTPEPNPQWKLWSTSTDTVQLI